VVTAGGTEGGETVSGVDEEIVGPEPSETLIVYVSLAGGTNVAERLPYRSGRVKAIPVPAVTEPESRTLVGLRYVIVVPFGKRV
jgi:hypothetical protein